jgi:hypothetical protein
MPAPRRVEVLADRGAERRPTLPPRPNGGMVKLKSPATGDRDRRRALAAAWV